MECFEELLTAHRSSVERYVRFRLSSKADADDVLQEVYLTAYRKFDQLKNVDAFRAWLISIARSKCSDYFREKATQWEISIDIIAEKALFTSRHGVTDVLTYVLWASPKRLTAKLMFHAVVQIATSPFYATYRVK